MSEWREYRLGDLLKIKYGKDHKKLGNGGIPVYGSGGIMRTGNAYLSDKPSVLIPRKGSLSNIFYVEEPFWTVDTMFWSEINDNVVLPKYLYYAIKDYKWDSLNVGSAVPSLTVPVIESVLVSIPSLKIQRKIAAQLSEIDSKISINRRICENLEAQAQALFKHWFIDFAPFKDGQFVDSELGMIPVGWRVASIEELASVKRGGSPRPIQNYISKQGLNWLKISDATASNSPFILSIREKIKKEGLNKTVFLKKGNLVLSNSATPCIPKILGVDSCIHDGWLYFPESRLSNAFLFLYFQRMRKQLLQKANGSVFLNLKTDIVKSQQFVCPDKDTLARFDSIVNDLFVEIYNMTEECIKLIDLRDTLLPKLMSGQIKV